MNKKHVLVLLGLTSLVFAIPASAQSADELTKRPTEVRLLSEAVDGLNSSCGTKLTVTEKNFDWASFKGSIADDSGHHVGMNCGTPLQILKGMCNGTPAMQAAVQKGITNVKCTANTGSKLTYEVKNKALVSSTNLNGMGFDQTAMKDYFGKHL